MAALSGETPTSGVVFHEAVSWVIDQAEGGAKLVNDLGGLTRFGISQKAFPNVDIKALTREGAESLYFEHYWKPVKGNALPAALALVVFDAAVNMGVATATKLLQTALRIQADGDLGPATVSAAKTFLPKQELVALVIAERLRWYHDLVWRKPVYTQWLKGWQNRCMRLAMEAGRWRSV